MAKVTDSLCLPHTILEMIKEKLKWGKKEIEANGVMENETFETHQTCVGIDGDVFEIALVSNTDEVVLCATIWDKDDGIVVDKEFKELPSSVELTAKNGTIFHIDIKGI